MAVEIQVETPLGEERAVVAASEAAAVLSDPGTTILEVVLAAEEEEDKVLEVVDLVNIILTHQKTLKLIMAPLRTRR